MNKEQKAVALLQSLVQQPSISGSEGGVTRVAADNLRALGFDEVQHDATGNVIGKIIGKKAGNTILFDAHLDVVPVTTPENWQHEPFSGDLTDGRVWGRGATDNKGSFAAMAVGLGSLVREEIRGTIVLVGSVGEETLEGVGLAPVVDSIKPDVVVIGEPTACQLGYCQLGRVRVTFNVTGKAAHSSAGDQSGNAIYRLGTLIERLEKHPIRTDAVLGRGIQSPIEVISNPYPSLSTMPYSCSMAVDRRLVLGETIESVLVDYQVVVDELPDSGVEIDVKTYTSYTGKTYTWQDFHPAWLTSLDSVWVKCSLSALTAAGIEEMTCSIPYCTNASYSAGVLGLPAVVFGPGNIVQAHAMNECLFVDELLRAMNGYAEMGKRLGIQ